MTSSRQQLAQLKKLLLSRDIEQIIQGVEIATSLNDPALWQTLLEGVTTAKDDAGEQSLVVNKLFTGPQAAAFYHNFAMTLLVAYSPFAELRSQVTAIDLSRWGQPHLLKLPLEGIERFPELRVLSFIAPAQMPSLGVLSQCHRLERLTIAGEQPITDLKGLGESKTLVDVDISAPLQSVSGIEGAPLHKMTLSMAVAPDLQGLAGTPIEELIVHGGASLSLPVLPHLRLLHARSLGSSAVQPAVRELVMVGSTALPQVAALFPALARLTLCGVKLANLEPLRDCVIETLILDQCEIESLAPIDTLPKLRSLCLHELRTRHLQPLPRALNVDREGNPSPWLRMSGWKSQLRSIRAIGQLEGVLAVDLSQCAELYSFEGLANTAIRVIDARGCTALSNVDALEEMPVLEQIVLDGTKWGSKNLPKSIARKLRPPGVLTISTSESN